MTSLFDARCVAHLNMNAVAQDEVAKVRTQLRLGACSVCVGSSGTKCETTLARGRHTGERLRLFEATAEHECASHLALTKV